jgi:hypothetical protein
MYYISLMTILSWKSILTNYKFNPKLNFIFLQWATLIDRSHKKYHDTLILLIHDHVGVIPRNILNAQFFFTSLFE